MEGFSKLLLAKVSLSPTSFRVFLSMSLEWTQFKLLVGSSAAGGGVGGHPQSSPSSSMYPTTINSGVVSPLQLRVSSGGQSDMLARDQERSQDQLPNGSSSLEGALLRFQGKPKGDQPLAPCSRGAKKTTVFSVRFHVDRSFAVLGKFFF